VKPLRRIRARVIWRQMAIFLGAIVVGGIAAAVAASLWPPAGYLALIALFVVFVYWWNAFELVELYEADDDAT